jgi:transcription elongation factor Elf1
VVGWKLGRRRRKVVRMPKKRLPKTFDCPECGKTGTIGVNIAPKNPLIIAKCGECAKEVVKEFLGDKEIAFECQNEKCPNYKQTISLVRPFSGNVIIAECGKCHGKTLLQLPLEDAPINCSCEPQKQVRLSTRPAERVATLICGSCALTCYLLATPADEPVDIYGKFLDRYYGKR